MLLLRPLLFFVMSVPWRANAVISTNCRRWIPKTLRVYFGFFFFAVFVFPATEQFVLFIFQLSRPSHLALAFAIG
jgi:hypothetical protein